MPRKSHASIAAIAIRLIYAVSLITLVVILVSLFEIISGIFLGYVFWFELRFFVAMLSIITFCVVIYGSFTLISWTPGELIEAAEAMIAESPVKRVVNLLPLAVAMVFIFWHTNRNLNFAEYAYPVYMLEALLLIVVGSDIVFGIAGSKWYIALGKYLYRHFPWVLNIRKYVIFFCFVAILILSVRDFWLYLKYPGDETGLSPVHANPAAEAKGDL